MNRLTVSANEIKRAELRLSPSFRNLLDAVRTADAEWASAHAKAPQLGEPEKKIARQTFSILSTMIPSFVMNFSGMADTFLQDAQTTEKSLQKAIAAREQLGHRLTHDLQPHHNGETQDLEFACAAKVLLASSLGEEYTDDQQLLMTFVDNFATMKIDKYLTPSDHNGSNDSNDSAMAQ